MATLAFMRKAIEARLEIAGVYNPVAEAETLLAHVMGIDKEALRALPAQHPLADALDATVESILQQREQHLPLSRIFGGIRFGDCSIDLAEGVFDPIPDSETMVDYATLLFEEKRGEMRVLDLGTGSGCVLLAVLRALPHASGMGIDCSAKAIALARHNADKNGLAARAQFREGNWAQGVEEQFDLILCAPPQVPHAMLPELMPEVRLHDPAEALDGGPDGLSVFRVLAKELDRLLQPDGVGIFQTIPAMADPALRIFQKAGHAQASIKNNALGIPSCLVVHKSAVGNPEKRSLLKQWFGYLRR